MGIAGLLISTANLVSGFTLFGFVTSTVKNVAATSSDSNSFE